MDAAGGYADRFLLTPLREGRPVQLVKGVEDLFISTLAPAGGATSSTVPLVFTFSNFYSRPCGRGDFRYAISSSRSMVYFYSRPCGRGDTFEGKHYISLIISTHAPAGGATRYCVNAYLQGDISTHAPAGGATQA